MTPNVNSDVTKDQSLAQLSSEKLLLTVSGKWNRLTTEHCAFKFQV